MKLSDIKNSGHWPTLLTAFLYFDFSFMVWTVLGAQIGEALHLSAEQKGFMVAVPILSGAILRIALGLLGTKTKIGGESVDGYHVFVGGGFGKHQAVGRQVFTGVAFEDLKLTMEKMLRGYLRHREGRETFQAFTARHDLSQLQGFFSNDE